MIVIRMNFIKPKAPNLYRDTKKAVKQSGIAYNNWSSGLGNVRYETWYKGWVLLVKEYHHPEIPVPIGLRP